MSFSNDSKSSKDLKKAAKVDCCYQIFDDTNLILPSFENSSEKYGTKEKRCKSKDELSIAEPKIRIRDEVPLKKALAKFQLKRNKRKLRTSSPRNNLRLNKKSEYQITFLESGQPGSPIEFFTSPLNSSEFITKLKIPPQSL